MYKTEWFQRKFPRIDDNGILPSIIERLQGTPARAEEILKGQKTTLLEIKPDGKWSIKEHIGHLADLELLWYARLEELMTGVTELKSADLTNRTTHEANHNATNIQNLLHNFRQLRLQLTDKLRTVNEEQLEYNSLHPRLKTPMRIIDLAYFVAEHDDHHLAVIRSISIPKK